ncbi:hypothetical protein [Streptomyces echinatus]|uniref:hypothetical protein n=1 Tax=Streptomyces echinatus TaxID=67293 RepID=UPI0031E5C9A2
MKTSGGRQGRRDRRRARRAARTASAVAKGDTQLRDALQARWTPSSLNGEYQCVISRSGAQQDGALKKISVITAGK